jgi:aminoglycoside 3-N-acetyltransferase I
MGLGKVLIFSLQAYCKGNGINEMFVSAHEKDQHALDFYRSTGGSRKSS